ncbi:hypothetical protein pb186bvf_012869 [Paramecium bursaria]
MIVIVSQSTPKFIYQSTMRIFGGAQLQIIIINWIIISLGVERSESNVLVTDLSRGLERNISKIQQVSIILMIYQMHFLFNNQGSLILLMLYLKVDGNIIIKELLTFSEFVLVKLLHYQYSFIITNRWLERTNKSKSEQFCFLIQTLSQASTFFSNLLFLASYCHRILFLILIIEALVYFRNHLQINTFILKNKLFFYNYFLMILLLILLVHISYTKQVTKRFKLSQFNEWKYLTKFGGDIGENPYTLKLRLDGAQPLPQKNIIFHFELYLDNDYDEFTQKQGCDRRDYAKRQEKFLVPTSAEWTPEFQGTLNQVMRTHVWYFAISDCLREITDHFERDMQNKVYLEVEFKILNSGNVEFSTEQRGIVSLQSVMLIISILLLVLNFRLMRQRQIKYEEFNLPLFFLVLNLFIETLSYTFNLIHLIAYGENGKGIAVCQIISLLLQVCSQFMLTMLFVLMSWGWSIKFIKFDKVEAFLATSFLVGFFQLTIVGIGFIDNDAMHKYHNYEGWVGWLASVIFLAELLYFLAGSQKTYITSNGKVQEFITYLAAYGTIYFLSFPVLQTVNLIVAPYLRHKVMELGTGIFRFGAILLLTRMFTSKNSSYKSVSYDNQSFLDRSKSE